jgi:hypothetical protein
MKLITESDDELIDQFEYNWPILDYYADSIIVNNGVTPPDSELYDGCLVAERTSGKLWMASRNLATGLFDKSWIVYPWTIESSKTFATNGSNNVLQGFPTLEAANCVNAGAADIEAGTSYIIIPIAGIYAIWTTLHINGTGAASKTYNNVVVMDTVGQSGTEMIMDSISGQDAVAGWDGNYAMGAGTKVGFRIGDFSGGDVHTGVMRIGITMISPLN